MTQLNLLTALREYLVAEDLVRVPHVAGVNPPLWLEPRDGVNAPGQGRNSVEIGPDAVLAAEFGTGIPPRRYEGFIRTDTVTIWVRTKTAPLAHQIEAQLRGALNDKRGWPMAGIIVNESLLVRDLQRLSFDQNGYTGNLQYSFSIWES